MTVPMSRRDTLIAEFTRETQTARRDLTRVPEAQFDWRPHAKSFTCGQLGGHIAECVRWAEHIFAGDELDMDPAAYVPIRPGTPAALLDAFDAAVEGAVRAMRESADEDVAQPWVMRLRGKTLFEKDRESAYRDMALSHLIHHRGQLTVYLRLLNVPLAGTYGPTADTR